MGHDTAGGTQVAGPSIEVRITHWHQRILGDSLRTLPPIADSMVSPGLCGKPTNERCDYRTVSDHLGSEA